jgi:hypothetical protein
LAGQADQGPNLQFILRFGLVTNGHQMRFVLRFLVTISHLLRKHLGRRDQAVDVIASVLPFNLAITLEGVEIDFVEAIVADLGQCQANLDEGLPTAPDHLLARPEVRLLNFGQEFAVKTSSDISGQRQVPAGFGSMSVDECRLAVLSPEFVDSNRRFEISELNADKSASVPDHDPFFGLPAIPGRVYLNDRGRGQGVANRQIPFASVLLPGGQFVRGFWSGSAKPFCRTAWH